MQSFPCSVFKECLFRVLTYFLREKDKNGVL